MKKYFKKRAMNEELQEYRKEHGFLGAGVGRRRRTGHVSERGG